MTLRRKLVLASVAHASRLQGLQRIGAIFGTDKAQHTRHGRTNLEIYETYLGVRRHRQFTLLELGVYRGDSLRAFDAYLSRASVIGLDVDPAAVQRAAEFRIYVGSQDDPGTIERIWTENADIEVVIDDASHVNVLTFASFDLLFPRLPSGGLYIIEDLAPGGYGRDWAGADAMNADGLWGRGWPGMDRNEGLSLEDNRRVDLEAFRNRLAYDCDLGPWDEALPGQVAFLHQWPSILVIGRA